MEYTLDVEMSLIQLVVILTAEVYQAGNNQLLVY
jgi:hypothetical protein